MKTIKGKFEGGKNFGFLIPDDRDYYGGDFYISKKNFGLAESGDRVEGVEIKTKGKKPEAKIVKVYGKTQVKKPKFIEGIFSVAEGDFAFVDVEGQEKGYLVFGKKRNGAQNGDKVKAELVEFRGKTEAVVVKIFKQVEENIIGKFKDNDSFGFVIPTDKNKGDIFIAGHRKNGAENGDKVEVKIVKKGIKKPEGIIVKIFD